MPFASTAHLRTHRPLHRVNDDTHLDIMYAQIFSGACTIKDMCDEDKAVDVINVNGARCFFAFDVSSFLSSSPFLE